MKTPTIEMSCSKTTAREIPIILTKADALADKVINTNNGYLFCPTTEEIYIATLFPDRFSINYAPLAKDFPLRITRK
jgi:hypothetical protein